MLHHWLLSVPRPCDKPCRALCCPSQVDDVGNKDWVGVLDAVTTFTRQNAGLAPFLWTCNKMYFSNVHMHAKYLDFARKHSCLRCSSNLPNGIGKPPHTSSYSIGSWELCVSMDLDCQCIA